MALQTVLSEHDFLFSNHRGHGYYLARFKDPQGLLAEIMGRQGAVCRGVGGSQHIYREGFLSTGIQGESLPIATGVALHLKRKADHRLAVVHMGDGTWGEGAVYEALNIAQLWQLPLLIIVENNQIAQSTPTKMQMAGSIAGRARAFDVNYLHVSSDDIVEIREIIAPFIHQSRATQSPLVIEFATYRLGPHSKGDDTRSAAELQALQTRDWYGRYQKSFPTQFVRVESQVRKSIENLIKAVEASPLSTWEGV